MNYRIVSQLRLRKLCFILQLSTVAGWSFSPSTVLAQNTNIHANQPLNLLDVASQIIRMDYIKMQEHPSAQRCKTIGDSKANHFRRDVKSLYYYHRDSKFLGLQDGSGHCYIWLVDKNTSRSDLLTNALLSSFANRKLVEFTGGLPDIQDALRKINGLHFRDFGFHVFQSSNVCLSKVNRWRLEEKASWAVWSHQGNNCLGILSDKSFVTNP